VADDGDRPDPAGAGRHQWGIPGTGVLPMDDTLEQPLVVDGMMEPLAPSPGLGRLVHPAWIAAQQVLGPDGLLDDL
jgi:hypothetical protein